MSRIEVSAMPFSTNSRRASSEIRWRVLVPSRMAPPWVVLHPILRERSFTQDERRSGYCQGAGTGKLKTERCTPCPAGIAVREGRVSPQRRGEAEIGDRPMPPRFVGFERCTPCPAGGDLAAPAHVPQGRSWHCPAFFESEEQPHVKEVNAGSFGMSGLG